MESGWDTINHGRLSCASYSPSPVREEKRSLLIGQAGLLAWRAFREGIAFPAERPVVIPQKQGPLTAARLRRIFTVLPKLRLPEIWFLNNYSPVFGRNPQHPRDIPEIYQQGACYASTNKLFPFPAKSATRDIGQCPHFLDIPKTDTKPSTQDDKQKRNIPQTIQFSVFIPKSRNWRPFEP